MPRNLGDGRNRRMAGMAGQSLLDSCCWINWVVIAPTVAHLCGGEHGGQRLRARMSGATLDASLPANVSGQGIVVTDPAPMVRGTGAEIRINGRHYQVWAYGLAGYHLRSTMAGDRIWIVGQTREISGVPRASYRRRHIAGVITPESVTALAKGTPLDRTANMLRNRIAGGSSSMPPKERALLTGFVFGDDRNEDEQTKKDFLAANMSHLLAVSGSNVAFVLLLSSMALKRFGTRGRFVGGLCVLVLFGVVTRWEPSVIRAEMMALVALIAVAQGRPISKWQCLSLGSTWAIAIDPFLIGSVGFLLSVSACIGMAALGEGFQIRFRGPLWLRRAIAYSAAAQLGVIPVQWAVFRELSGVGLITNVLAEPLAGAVMVWGVVGGLMAGFAPSSVAYLVHVPNYLMLSVIGHIAHYGAVAEASSAGRIAALTLTALGLIGLSRPKAATSVQSDDASSTVGLSNQGR